MHGVLVLFGDEHPVACFQINVVFRFFKNMNYENNYVKNSLNTSQIHIIGGMLCSKARLPACPLPDGGFVIKTIQKRIAWERVNMKILLVYPCYAESFWSFKHALKFIDKKAAYPPLGLLTVAALLPAAWDKRLVDMNVRKLNEKDIKWADYVFISAMAIQTESTREVLKQCKELGVKTVAGGPLFTMGPEDFPEVDHLVLHEGEATLPEFLKDLEKGSPRRIYDTRGWPGLADSPIPLWDLINFKDYASMSVQFSRGCPFHCDFCNITSLFGKNPRLKSAGQLMEELDSLYHRGWRGGVFIVDDNFIGNKVVIKRDVLPAMIRWMKDKKYPFNYITEASINMADDPELMRMMSDAGFVNVFVGIETPSEEGLRECNKFQNTNRSLLASIRDIQRSGIQVSAGFIVGFDSDTPGIFDRMISFVEQSGIATAMVGLLNAPIGTKLFERLSAEKRILRDFSGNNTDYIMNFKPRMEPQKLVEGYRKIVTTIYSPEIYYMRISKFLKEFRPVNRINISRLHFCYFKALCRATFILGFIEKGRKHYWKMILRTTFKHPARLPEAIALAVYGFHFRKIFNKPAAETMTDEVK